MANVPPPSKAPRLPMAPPPPQAAPQNMSTPNGDVLQPLNFKVDPKLHLRFKQEAVARGMTMRDLLEACFRTYLETHPIEHKPELF